MTAPVDHANPTHKIRFCVCGCNACRAGDHLNCPHETCESRTVSMLRVQRVNAILVAHAFPWCRARLLHALGSAEEQGILAEVLDEVMGDRPEEIQAFRDHLHRHGWVAGNKVGKHT